ncbi:T9SS type B sorting domain-containing protein [Mucilaginibacter ginsenosidivorans]|uniref:T9SS type B sorting domain-containing protein n=1 Tax=Mucilaginibacter ginsenosidivorans TaxID=398053 RepID=A0A5B8UVS3_9SPHI|nr:gliding motility-associated C-terminal domain-containing protein [Mucilaginibacter ginsenosidivorans]QEC62536.1 T9SS type B sorting domain-containing protein [Mucilaginibacter ginsenosidivorans]
MKRLILFSFLFVSVLRGAAQGIVQDCVLGQALQQTVNYCSAAGEFSNNNKHKSMWFVFKATAHDVNISVSSLGLSGGLASPVVRLYSDCSGTELVGSSIAGAALTSLYKGGLIIGATYYLQVTGDQGQLGVFSLCLNNYNPVVKPGQDCATASVLCTTEAISQQDVTGAGADNDEAKGTCLSVAGQASEANSAWYKWQAANSGTLVFTITPSDTRDDIDWVLFDLGTTGDCSGVRAANAIRCKAGAGVDVTDCPGDKPYYKTGLDFGETDVSEPPGCGQGQNGKLAFLTMQQGHFYALLINNFSSGNNGFSLAFTDEAGKAGTGLFAGPQPVIGVTAPPDCTEAPQYVFTSKSVNYTSLQWSFGEGASPAGGSGEGPFAVSYAMPGPKTVTLEAGGAGGCTVVAVESLLVRMKPALPVISVNKAQFCVGDTLRLETAALEGASYAWSGPGGFRSAERVVALPVTGAGVAGVYALVVTRYGCESGAASVVVPAPLVTPVAAFTTDPLHAEALYPPLTVNFINGSSGADRYAWDFGDGTVSPEVNPVHVYTRKGDYAVRLTAYNSGGCSASALVSGVASVRDNNYVFIPNGISPNGDGKNDDFRVVMTNIRSFHVYIYDRWGSLLFESGDISHHWDGTYRGRVVPQGTYYYKIEAVGEDGELLRRSGYVAVAL